MSAANKSLPRVFLVVISHGFVYIGSLVSLSVEEKLMCLNNVVNLRNAETTKGFGELVNTVPKGNYDPVPSVGGSEFTVNLAHALFWFELDAEVWASTLKL